MSNLNSNDRIIVHTNNPDSPFIQWMKKAMPDVEVNPTCDHTQEDAREGLLCRECGQSANENWFTYGVDHFGVCDACEVYWLMGVNMAGNALDDVEEEIKRAEFVIENYAELDPKPSAILTPRQVECYLGSV